MQVQYTKKRTCYVAGCPEIPSGYASVLEYELDNLISRGVICFVFTGVGPFERLCLETLQKLQKCYDYIPIRLALIGVDARWLADYQEDFDALLCIRRISDPDLQPSRYAVHHSQFLFYFQQTDSGGTFSDIQYGQDMGLCLVNAAKSKREADKYPYTSL